MTSYSYELSAMNAIIDTPTKSADELADDSDKTFTVTAAKTWTLLGIFVSLATSATVGNRQLAILITDASNVVLCSLVAGAVQAAGATRFYSFFPGAADLTAFRDTDKITNPLPQMTLPAGYKIRVYDNAAVAAAADDMLVRLMVHQRDV